MAQKALVAQVYEMTLVDGAFTLTIDAVVENGAGDHFHVTAYATANHWSPDHPTWRQRVASAVKAAALAHDPSVEIDSLMFQDFVVLGV